MKKIIRGLIMILPIILLSACTNPITIKQGVVDVQYDNIRYEGDSIVVDIWITNGTSKDVTLGSVDFWMDFPDDINVSMLNVSEFCGSTFTINVTIQSESYRRYEIEFTSDYIFVTPEELTGLNFEVSDLLLFFDYNQ